MNFLTSDLLFYFFAAIAVIAAILVVMKSNPVGSAMCMAISFGATAGIMFILGAHFLGVIQILVYTGAIMVLFLFIIMLLNVKAEESSFRRPLPMIIGFIIVAVFMLQLGGVIYSIPGAKDAHYCPMAKACEVLDELCVKTNTESSEKPISEQKNTLQALYAQKYPIIADYFTQEPGQILDSSLTKAYDKIRKKEIETITAVREPVIIVGKDGNAYIALEKVAATTQGNDISVKRNITIMNEVGDIVENIIEDSEMIPSDIKNAPQSAQKDNASICMIAGVIDEKNPDITKSPNGSDSIQLKVSPDESQPFTASRPVGSSPKMNFPTIRPELSAMNYPVGSAIRTAIDKGDFPDTALLGRQIFLKYNAAFVIVSLSLLVATIGVVVLCRKFNKD